MADTYSPHVERLSAVAVAPSRRLLAVGGKRDVRGQTLPTSVTVLTVTKFKAHATFAVDAEVCTLLFANDDIVLVGTVAGTLSGWDVAAETPKQLFELPLHTGAIRALGRDTLGNVLATCGDDGMLRLLRLDSDSTQPPVVFEKRLSARPLRAVAIDPGARTVAVAGDDSMVRTLALAAAVDGSSDGNSADGNSADGNSADGSADGNADGNSADGNSSAVDLREMAMPAAVGCLTYTGDGRIACGLADGSVQLCYLEGEADVQNRAGEYAHHGMVHALIYGPELFDDGGRRLDRRLFSIGEDGELKSWQLDSKRRPKTVELGKAALRDMAWVPAGRGTKAERRGGTLVLVDWRRRISALQLSETSTPADTIKRIGSRLDELAVAVRAKGEKVRRAAIEALGQYAEAHARKRLDKALANDDKPALRVLAAQVIERSGWSQSRPALRAALNDKTADVRAAALHALTALESDTPLAAARAALVSSHADMAVAALERMPALRASSPLVPSLIAGALSHASSVVRNAALDALYSLESDRPDVAARVAMQRGPADVRREVLLRVARATSASAAHDASAAQLLERALDDEDALVRERAFLVNIGSRGALATAVCAVDTTTRAALTKLEAGGAFSKRDNLTVTELTDTQRVPLFSALACRNADTALRAATCLALLGDRRATGALLQLSRETDPQVRRRVVAALHAAAIAMPADDRATARLRWLIDDTESTIRNAAFDALTKLGETDGGPAELALAALALRCSQHDIRLRALPLLVRFGGDGQYAQIAELSRDADTLLGDALDDEHDKVRGEAFRTLWTWHHKAPETVLARAARSRQADVRTRVVTELGHQLGKKAATPGDWIDTLLLALVGDSADVVGLAAVDVLAKGAGTKRVEVFAAALNSPRAAVRSAGCVRAPRTAKALVDALVTIIKDDELALKIAALEAVDRIDPVNAQAFALGLGSEFYELRVRAMELCGVRRDARAVAPATSFLSIAAGLPKTPLELQRRRAARALADIGDADSLRFYSGLLDDQDEFVREMGARALATACRPGDEQPLVDALAHQDLAVRSWAAEGLARLGDARAVPVLAGTLRHDHIVLRQGAIMGFVALGPDGVVGILQGLDDSVREIQDLVFGCVVARDVALAAASLPPDLLLSALASAHPEIRFAAARVLEERTLGSDQVIRGLARQLVGPRIPDKAADAKQWPDEAEQNKRLGLVVDALASDHPALRYAAVQTLSLRSQPLAFWREAKHLGGPTSSKRPRLPFTNWDNEPKQPRKVGWLRSLFRPSTPTPPGSGTEQVIQLLKYASAQRPLSTTSTTAHAFDAAAADHLAFGTYAGLVRQAPLAGDSDETHRVRRDSIQRLAALAERAAVGHSAVLPMLRQALSDPHHMVRRAAVGALRELRADAMVESLRLELQSSAADVGRGAVDELINMAANDVAALAVAKTTIDAPVAEVRAYALSQLPRLFEAGSLEPWLLALASEHADVRLSVVDRLVDSTDERVAEALTRAMESDHEDLRLKAAVALANRGETLTVDVLAGLLRSAEQRVWRAALQALIALALHRGADGPKTRAAAARTVVGRLDDDPDQTANRTALVDALGRIASPAAGDAMIALLGDDDTNMRATAFACLLCIANDPNTATRIIKGHHRAAYQEDLALDYVAVAATSDDMALRQAAAATLRDIDDARAEVILANLVEDREETVRIAACEALAFRTRFVPGASLDALSAALRGGRRELVLPAATGLANQQRPEAFQGLLLVFKAGDQAERSRAILALGTLGDVRALPELEPLLDPKAELEPEDLALAPDVVEALGRMIPSVESTDTAERLRELVENIAREGSAELRARALTGMRHAGDDRSRAFLRQVAADRLANAVIRRHAIEQLGDLGYEDAEELLAAIVSGPDGYVLGQAALDALRLIFPNDHTRTNLIALQSSQPAMSEPAAAFLAWHGDAQTLVRRMATIKDDSVRQRLRQGLVRRAECPRDDVAALLAGEAMGARADGAWIAGAAKDEALAPAIVTAVERSAVDYAQIKQRASGDDELATSELRHTEAAWQASLWAAQQVGADVQSHAEAAIASSGTAAAPPQVRCAALRYLAAFGTASPIVVTQALSDPSAQVRTAAAATLATLSPDTATQTLADLTVPDVVALAPIVRVALTKEPGQLLATSTGRQLAVPLLLADGNLDSLTAAATTPGTDAKRRAAIAALGRSGNAAAVTTLEGILANADEDDAVRAATFRALRRLQRRVSKQRQLAEANA